MMFKEMGSVLSATAIIVLAISGMTLGDSAVNLNPHYSSGGWPVAGSNHGWQFTVNNPIMVTHLGLFDQDDNGFLIAHPIGLWRLSDSALLVSGTMSAGTVNPLTNHFRYIDIPDVPLSTGVNYVVGFYSALDDADWDITKADELQINPAINIVVGRWDISGQFQMPTNLAQDPDNPDRFGPNFMFIPEPATIALLAFGGLMLRRNRKVF